MKYPIREEDKGGEGGAGGAAGGAAAPAVAPAGGGAAAQDWRNQLSAEYKDAPSLKDFTDINQFAKAHIDTKAMVGRMIRVPGEDASQADVQAFRDKLLSADLGVIPTPDLTNPEEAAKYYQRMGAPAEADGYTKIEGMPEARQKALAALAHEAGISDKQFAQVAAKMVAGDTESNNTIIAERDKGISELKSDWGEAYDQKFARAQRLVEATKAPDMLLTAIKEGGVDAATLRWLDSVAAAFGGEGSNLKDIGTVTADDRSELEGQRDELTRRLQSSERMPSDERQRLIAKNVDLNARILALTA